jgi:hypothetical protein
VHHDTPPALGAGTRDVPGQVVAALLTRAGSRLPLPASRADKDNRRGQEDGPHWKPQIERAISIDSGPETLRKSFRSTLTHRIVPDCPKPQIALLRFLASFQRRVPISTRHAAPFDPQLAPIPDLNPVAHVDQIARADDQCHRARCRAGPLQKCPREARSLFSAPTHRRILTGHARQCRFAAVQPKQRPGQAGASEIEWRRRGLLAGGWNSPRPAIAKRAASDLVLISRRIGRGVHGAEGGELATAEPHSGQRPLRLPVRS